MESSAAMDDDPPSPSRDRNLVDDDNCEVRSPHPGLGSDSDSFSFSSSSIDEVYDEKLPRVSVKQRNNSLQWQNKTLYDYGIGKKLLEKMGYKLERGLGKNEQGITEPIIAKGRPCPRMGLGYHDPKERQRQRLRPEKPKVSKALPVSEGRVERNLWSKRAVGKEKTKQEDRTAGGDVLKVVDMRGPQPRVLTNLVNSNAEEGAKTEGLLMPELQHNIRLIVDLIGFDISKISEDLWRERERHYSA
ncbi:G-patch domain containing protein [Trema orientale]|uniref:G-patch domain containing protein n=1 Tax=Trema orientale TaxID=63057 RepID=A0A2P5EU33_TREOI|nr:G-patch domain containing protein [Trema orientale]